MFLQVMVLWKVACLRIKSGSYFLWNVAGGGGVLRLKTGTPGRILLGASQCLTCIAFCNFLMLGKLSVSQKKKIHLELSEWTHCVYACILH